MSVDTNFPHSCVFAGDGDDATNIYFFTTIAMKVRSGPELEDSTLQIQPGKVNDLLVTTPGTAYKIIPAPNGNAATWEFGDDWKDMDVGDADRQWVLIEDPSAAGTPWGWVCGAEVTKVGDPDKTITVEYGRSSSNNPISQQEKDLLAQDYVQQKNKLAQFQSSSGGGGSGGSKKMTTAAKVGTGAAVILGIGAGWLVYTASKKK